jgi:O-antigen/teichoic acid export membrane protein
MGNGSPTRLRNVYSFAVNMVTAIQLGVACAVLFFPAEILMIAGRDYVLQPQALGVLLVGNLANGFLGLSGLVVSGLGHSRIILVSNVLALVVNVGLNSWLIPILGITGAATATAAACLVQNMLLLAVQIRLVGSNLYAPHLGVNGALVVAFAVAVFGFQDAILPCSLPVRAAGFLLSLVLVGGVFWLKRKTFVPGGTGPRELEAKGPLPQADPLREPTA